MRIKRKDVQKLCVRLSEVIGPFSFLNDKGEILYKAPGTWSDPIRDWTEISVNGTTVGSISGDKNNLQVIRPLIELYLKNLDEKKRLTSHTLQKYREMQFISELNNMMSSSADLDEILRLATSRIKKMINIESCSIMIAEENSKTFHQKAASGKTVNEDSWLPTDKGIGGKVFRTGQSVIVNEPDRNPDFIQGGTTWLNSILCIPLRAKDKTIGILNLNNKEDGVFTTEDEALISSMSVTIAEAIENTRLLEAMIRSEKFSAIGQMAVGIIHDIKNPMTTIKGFAGLMGDMDFSRDERKEYSGLIVNEVDRLVSMIEDLLTFTWGFKTKLEFIEIGAEEFFSEVYKMIESDMKQRDIQVVLRLDCNDRFRMDPSRFKRVVFNIASNARKAMHEGGKLLILVRPSNGNVEIVMSDTGTGIPEDIIATAFEPFVTKGKRSGTGLGLAITKKIIEEHGGSITTQNGDYSGVEGYKGANFIISLPPCPLPL
jgi:signal transduction histidine kinase